MARVRRKGLTRRGRELDPIERAALMGEEYPDPNDKYFVTKVQLQTAWRFWGDALTAEWVEANPDTRPPGWWTFEAPALAKAAGIELPQTRPVVSIDLAEQRSILTRMGALTATEGDEDR